MRDEKQENFSLWPNEYKPLNSSNGMVAKKEVAKMSYS